VHYSCSLDEAGWITSSLLFCAPQSPNSEKKKVISSIFASRKYPNLEMKRDSPYLELVKRIDNSEEYPKNP
jgi:hypothetical protein